MRARWNLERPDQSPAVLAATLADLNKAIELGPSGSRERRRIMPKEEKYSSSASATKKPSRPATTPCESIRATVRSTVCERRRFWS